MSARAGVVVDTGLRSGPENIRLDRAQWRAAQDAETPVCHVRFHRYRPTVALGAFETAGHALRAEYCRDRGIAMARRVSGGAAVYLDPEQLCWTLTLSRLAAWGERKLADWLAGLCEAVASALQALGVDAAFVPPNDIEVTGRKLGSGFLALSDLALLFQGSLLLGHDTETMMKALRVPTEKLTPDGVCSARGRFATLREAGVAVALPALERHMLDAWAGLLGVEFGAKVEVIPEDMSVNEADTAAPAGDWDAEHDTWNQSLVKTPGGILYVRLRLSERGDTLQQVEISGGLQLYPAHLFTSLSSWLASTPVAWLDERIDEFFRAYPHDLLGFTVEDLRHGLHLALDRYAQQIQFALTREQANTLMVHAPAPLAAADVANAANVMLVPYCAKPSWCKWRDRDGCPDCGLCQVGEAYRLAHERGMRVVTITDFEHLEKTLDELRAQDTRAYVGMCCRHCYLKREYVFRAAGIPAVLMDIAGSNCYELQQEDLACAGEFQAQAYLDLEVLRKVLRRVPPVTGKTD
jgi:lipoate-protein ligase A